MSLELVSRIHMARAHLLTHVTRAYLLRPMLLALYFEAPLLEPCLSLYLEHIYLETLLPQPRGICVEIIKNKRARESDFRGKMHVKESTTSNFNLPDDILVILSSHSFEQLDIARNITSIALSIRVPSLERELLFLHAKLSDKNDIIANLQQFKI